MIWKGAYAGVLASCLSLQPTYASENLAGDWLDLWSRCRIAIETGNGVNANGLDNLGLKTRVQAPLKTGDVILMPGYEYEEQSWGRRESEFVIREKEMPKKDGTVTRICDVQFSSEGHVLPDAEIAAIVNAFTNERTRLLELGGHEIRDPNQIFQVAIGVGPISKNQNNCRVISYLMVGSKPEDQKAPRFFGSSSGEQTIEESCSGPSLLRPHG